MKSQATTHTGTTSDGRQALVETGTVTGPNGQAFTAGGAFISEDLIVGYVSRDERGRLVLTTWDGERIMSLHETGRTTGWHRCEIYCYGGTFAGRYWHGRGAGEGVVLRLHRGKETANV